ncbi:MAG: ferrous iron transport protein B [Calditrichaeota bacterium]|nr:MAG: ferrous iron transport protein B [Calditrichota bacterium]
MNKNHTNRSLNEKVVLVGNPNVGKSVIFSILTGRYVTVSNYPGTTVEISMGRASYDSKKEEVIDTPGVNSLLPLSEDERVTRDILLRENPRLVVQVADAKNLRRALFLTVQLAEMGIPLVLTLNMMDEARSRGIDVNEERLTQMLGGIPVVKTIAIHRKGVSELIHTIKNSTPAANLHIQYPDEVESTLNQILPLLPETGISKRALGLSILSDDESLRKWLQENLDPGTLKKIESVRLALQQRLRKDPALVINQRRLQEAERIYQEVFQTHGPQRSFLSDFLGKITIHPVWGLFVLLAVLYGMYQFVGVFGAGTLVDYFEGVIFGKYITPFAQKVFTFLLPIKWLQEMFVGEYGLISMALSYSIAIVLPVVTTFFLAFGFLEDTGYLPRLAVMLNRIFKVLGLNGKAVLPMVLGLGCDTMATLTTRILETRKERVLVTLLLALGIPCSAQLGVILGLLGGLSMNAVLVWLVCVVGVLILVGFLASKVLPGERSEFILELPPIRRPSLANIAIKTLARIEWYLKEAVPLFFLGTFVLFVLAKTGLLDILEKGMAPLIQGFLGLPKQASEAFLVGFLRRDYGAAGLFSMARHGLLNSKQIIVSLVTITLFVPCIANFFVIIKERGWKTALAIFLFIMPFAFLVGGLLNFILSWSI